MAAKNDITGEAIVSKPPSELYRKNWDLTFGWKDISEGLPTPGEDVAVKSSSGDTYEAYLCPCCKSEWRDPFTGSHLTLAVTHWKPL